MVWLWEEEGEPWALGNSLLWCDACVDQPPELPKSPFSNPVGLYLMRFCGEYLKFVCCGFYVPCNILFNSEDDVLSYIKVHLLHVWIFWAIFVMEVCASFEQWFDSPATHKIFSSNNLSSENPRFLIPLFSLSLSFAKSFPCFYISIKVYLILYNKSVPLKLHWFSAILI